jgi:hypothetical protein
MIRTLRITSIIVAITAVVLLILLVVVPANRGTDPKIEEFLKTPGSIDKFTAAKGQRPAKDESQTSPLVKYAADFAKILNPPPPPPPASTGTTQAQSGPAPPAPVAVKFDLVGTSFYATKPEMSLALINEPGKGFHWVKQGGSVGHLIIERVGDGVITVRDGQRTSDMTVKVEEPWRKLLKNPPPETRPGQPAAAQIKSASAADTRPPAAIPTKSVDSSPAPVADGRITAPPPAGQSRARPVPSAFHPPTSSAAQAKSRPPGRAGKTGTAGNESPQPGQPGAGQAGQRQPAATEPAAVSPAQGAAVPESASADSPAQAGRAETSESEGAPPKSEKEGMVDQLMANLNSSKVTDEEAARIKQLVEAIKELDKPQSESAVQPDASPAEQGSKSESHPDANQ